MSRFRILNPTAVISFAIVWSISSFSPITWSQTLADRVPADAVVYVGWRGSEALGKDYDASHLKAVLAESDLPKVFSDFFPRLVERVGKSEPQAREGLAMVQAIGSLMWRHPSAFYVGPSDPAAGPGAMPNLLVMCQAGADAPALAQQVQSAILKSAAGGPTPPIHVKTAGDLVVVSTVEHPDKPTDALAASEGFKAAMSNVAHDPVATIYVDGPKLVAMFDQLAAANEESGDMWPRVRDALGLGGVKSLAWTGAFDGKDWSSRAFVGMAAERSGLLSLFNNKPLGDDILKTIPATAVIAGAGHLDLGKVFDEIRAGTGKVNTDAQQQFDQGMQFVNQILNLDVRNDVLASLGDTWAYYSDPTVSGNGLMGITIVNKLRDGTKAEQSLGKFETSINTLLHRQLMKENITIAFRQIKSGDLTIHYLATPLLSPAWTVHGGNLYVALYPQVLTSAVRATGTGKSILDNPAFVAVRKRLGAAGSANASSIHFIDQPKTAADGYQAWLMMSRMYLGMGDVFGVPSPAMVLPPLDKLMPHLSPSGTATWADDAGWHLQSISPFPGSNAMARVGGMGGSGAAESALAVSILLPSLNRARETANRVKCSSNLRQIALASILYANDHKGNFPPDMGSLIKEEDITAETFVCPSTNDSVPPGFKDMKPDEQAAWVNQHSSYVYLGSGKPSAADTHMIIAYEKEQNHDRDGMNIAFADAHVEWFLLEAGQQLIEQQQNKPAVGGKDPKNGGL